VLALTPPLVQLDLPPELNDPMVEGRAASVAEQLPEEVELLEVEVPELDPPALCSRIRLNN